LDPHFHLGDLTSTPAEVAANFQAFLTWIDTVHQPYAIANRIPACSVCQQHLQHLPPFEQVSTDKLH
jgi:hypothetical protein